MFILLLSLLLPQAHSHQSRCWQLMMNTPREVGSSEVSRWMKSNGATSETTPTDFSFRWDQWQKIQAADRDLSLSLELSRLAPHASNQKIRLNGHAELAYLSRQNFHRMVRRFNESYPLNKIVTELGPTIDQIAERLDLGYTRPIRRADGQTVTGPELSLRELQRLGIKSADTTIPLAAPFATVEWDTVIFDNRASPESALQEYITDDKIYLNEKVAIESGFFLPQLKTALDYFDFFDFWDPQAGEEVFELNRASFPRTFESYGEFRHALNGENPDEYFPPEKSIEQLAPFHHRLRDYILNAQDAKKFLVGSFRRWAYTLASIDQNDAKNTLESVLYRPNRLHGLIKSRVLPFLYMPNGLTLRVPLGVSASEYSIIRYYSPSREIPQFGGFSGMRRMGRP